MKNKQTHTMYLTFKGWVAIFKQMGLDDSEAEKRARLAIAAPDLLAALKTILTITAQNSGPGLDAIELLAAHVVAKAEGGR